MVEKMQVKTKTSSIKIAIRPSIGLRKPKKQTLHKKFTRSCAIHSFSILISPRCSITPSDKPISRQITLQAIGKTMAGGVRGDFAMQGYHSTSAAPCTQEPSHPTKKQSATGIKQRRNVRIYCLFLLAVGASFCLRLPDIFCSARLLDIFSALSPDTFRPTPPQIVSQVRRGVAKTTLRRVFLRRATVRHRESRQTRGDLHYCF